MSIRVILADDQAMVRRGIKLLLEREMADIRILGEAADGREAVRLAQEVRPDVAVLDLATPGLNGLDAAREIRRHLPLTKTILLTVHAEDRRVIEALRVGINGYVLKTQPPEELAHAIQEVARGGSFIDPKVVEQLVSARSQVSQPLLDSLTPRERQVLAEVAEGHNNAAIASELFLTERAVEKHINSIFSKLGLSEAQDVHRRVKAVLLFLADPTSFEGR